MSEIFIPEKNKQEDVYKVGDREFKVEKPDQLNPDNINPEDRVFITTKSGNRYMIRRSKSRGGTLMVYNEKADGFKVGYPIALDKGSTVEIGQDFNFIAVNDEKKGLGQKYHATEIMEIEIRRGLDKFIEEEFSREEKNDFGSATKEFARAIGNGKSDEL